jgi:phosphoribosylaminoimidazolecarboxamide formyltransferase/IMP cyclohydrolase
MQVRRSLLSVYDKTGIIEFAKALQELGIELISTGGTARALTQAGVKIIEVAELTGYPELLEGRVKTLHPKIQAGILADRNKSKHLEEIERNRILAIDLVAVNLYPFEKVISKEHTLEEAIENIDIGGVTLIRASAKNHKHVAVLTSPEKYKQVLEELRTNNLTISETTLKKLALEAFSYTAHYDSIIERYFRDRLGSEQYPQYLNLSFEKLYELRYGENPHQNAAFYKTTKSLTEPCSTNMRKLAGKELSYNNILDIDATLELLKEFSLPTCVIVKHTNPCGVASSTESLAEAYRLAYATDRISPFGGIVAFNRKVDLETAKELSKLFLEVIIAPSFTQEAFELLRKKKALRILEVDKLEKGYERKGFTLRSVVGGLLIQDRDLKELEDDKLKLVTRRAPTKEELAALKFGFKVVRHCKSNALVYAKKYYTVAIGLGQTSRVDSAYIALKKGAENIKGSVLVSDAFFPFRDVIDISSKAGITAVLQPGGSIRDKEVIKAADEYNIAMVFSGTRVFRH